MGLEVSGVSGGGGRVLPSVSPSSFIYWDMVTTTTGKLKPGDNPINIKNLGNGGALDLTVITSNGDGAPLACAGPAGGGGVDIGGTSSNQGSLATGISTAPPGNVDLLLSVAFRIRPGYGTGSPILLTKAYPAIGAGWTSPYNAFGLSLHGGTTGSIDCNVVVGGVNLSQTLGDRFQLATDTDYWLDMRHITSTGRLTTFVNGNPVGSFTPGNVIDWGAGEWMLGGNRHNANDSLNGPIYFAELLTATFTDAQVLARARAWLGWT